MPLPSGAPGPFAAFAGAFMPRTGPRARIVAARRTPEPECLPPLLGLAELPPSEAQATADIARRLIAGLRGRPMGIARENLVQGLLQEFALSSDEGVALMCLAEALLRIPDSATRDALIRDKIGRGDWRSHLGKSESPFINAAAWGLLVTGKLVSTHGERGLSNALSRVTARFGEPVVRKAVDLGMRLLGKQFVAGETIAEALANARRFEAQGFRYSYDMLGEAAMTAADAQRYYASYEASIDAIGAAAAGERVEERAGISIKLSALHPRYALAQRERVMAELYPKLLALTRKARSHDIGINIDAEESERLDISLDLLERLCAEPSLAGWEGIGFVVQAYQKRAPAVTDFLVELARATRRRLMVRLVKGAYWDAEIKRAQVDGMDGYPVFTRKSYTDVCYLACARKLLAAPDAVYPQFATHNAQTLASIYAMAGEYRRGQYEFQCLHGMGEPLYQQVVGDPVAGKLGRPCRVYAPVGTHETLLAYLVRRLLENGANSSFINKIADPRVSLDELVADPVDVVRRLEREEGTAGLPHPKIPLPRAIFSELRLNSWGVDLTDEATLERLAEALARSVETPWSAEPTLKVLAAPDMHPVRNPAQPEDVVGYVAQAQPGEVDAALRAAVGAAPAWQAVLPSDRAALLERAADAMEAQMPLLMGLIVREAGKTYANAVAEVREAVDFLRYYAQQARRRFANETHRALGPVVCISPWNFPLAIFTGQVSAALAAGNPVLAKPAEQTPLIAAEAVRLLHAAGVPRDALQLVPGAGESVGARLVADARVRGVVFTGSTDVARHIQRALAGRLDERGRAVPLIAETGGQNAMIVDSSALAEQVVSDAVVSAFDSAGQRCSALRVLCLQDDIAPRVVEMMKGAMDELAMGDPASLAVDVGPVIDEGARAALEAHIARMRQRGRAVYQAAAHASHASAGTGTFVAPTLIEIERIDELEREVFGPVLHVLRYRREALDALVDGINALGYGLTLGVHTRVDETIEAVVRRARAGNVYVNRNMIGAVVGVQPFGGENLSGTGPKAGGPLYLYRLLSQCPADAAMQELRALAAERAPDARRPSWTALCEGRAPAVRAFCDRIEPLAPFAMAAVLPGPTGERNSYSVLPRRRVLCLAANPDDLAMQCAAVLAVGGFAVCAAEGAARDWVEGLPKPAREWVAWVDAWTSGACEFDAVLHHGTPEELAAVCREVACLPGPVIAVHGFRPGEEPYAFERLLVERVVSVNTAAAGGNATLMTVG